MLRSALGTPPNTTILLDNMVCSGGEINLLECGHNGIGMVTCDRSHEAGVRCEGKLCNVLAQCPVQMRSKDYCTCFCTAFPNKNL